MVARNDYDRLAASYDDVRGDPPFLDAWSGRIAAALALGSGALVLDAGCGTGAYTTRLAARGFRMVGLDASRGMLAQARGKDARVAWARGAAQRLPLRDRSVDGVVATFLLHHLDDWPAFLDGAARVLRPDGALGLVTRSHQELRASVMAQFPGVLEIDLARFPDVPRISERLRARFGEVRVEWLSKGPHSVPVEEWVRRARRDFISTLSLLPDAGRERGVAEFERRLRARGATVEDRSTFTLLVARGPR